jgi:hypothetical protein
MIQDKIPPSKPLLRLILLIPEEKSDMNKTRSSFEGRVKGRLWPMGMDRG